MDRVTSQERKFILDALIRQLVIRITVFQMDLLPRRLKKNICKQQNSESESSIDFKPVALAPINIG